MPTVTDRVVNAPCWIQTFHPTCQAAATTRLAAQRLAASHRWLSTRGGCRPRAAASYYQWWFVDRVLWFILQLRSLHICYVRGVVVALCTCAVKPPRSEISPVQCERFSLQCVYTGECASNNTNIRRSTIPVISINVALLASSLAGTCTCTNWPCKRHGCMFALS